MENFYTVREAAIALLQSAEKAVGNTSQFSDWGAWSDRIIQAILAGKLIGVHGGSAIDPNSPGAKVAAVVCEIRADDLNTWLDSIRCSYRFNKRNYAAKKIPAATDWKTKAIEIANTIGEQRWARGEREITKNNICFQVHDELAKDSSTFGQRGKRMASSIRSDALKGWTFTPKKV